MARFAGDAEVQAGERIFRLAVIERGIRQTDRFPVRRRMALFACPVERSTMRILVAIPTIGKRRFLERYVSNDSSRGRRRMTTGAGHLRMQACQSKPRRVVVESRRLFPGRLRVAVRAVGTQLILVHIGVARRTVCSKSQESLVEILHENLCSPRRGDVLWRVATGALQLRMLSFKCESRLRFVVEFGLWFGPAYECKIPPAMLRVAACAIVAADCRINDQSMVSALFRDALLDFHVTGRALQLRPSCSERVAAGATQKTVHAAMRLRERTR